MKPARLLQLAVGIGLVALLLWKADLQDVRGVLSDADAMPIVLAIALDAPVILLLFVRSRLVLETLGHDIETRTLLPVSILGNVAGSLTPAAAGELLRAGVLHSQAAVPAKDALALVTYERLMSVYLLALATGAFAAMVALPTPWAVLVAAIAGVLVLLPAALSPLLRLVPDARGGRSSLIGRILDSVLGAAEQTRLLLADLRLLVRWGCITAAIFAMNALQFLLLARSVSGVISYTEAWVAFGASQLAGIASLLPLGLGASDASLAALLGEMGLTLDEGATVAVLVRLTTTIPLGIAAIASYMYLLRRSPPKVAVRDETEATSRA